MTKPPGLREKQSARRSKLFNAEVYLERRFNVRKLVVYQPYISR